MENITEKKRFGKKRADKRGFGLKKPLLFFTRVVSWWLLGE